MTLNHNKSIKTVVTLLYITHQKGNAQLLIYCDLNVVHYSSMFPYFFSPYSS